MSKQIRLGVVGFGSRGRSLFSLSQKVPHLIPAAICEANVKLLAEAKERFPEAETYSDYGQMLAGGKIDAVMVETPATIHAPFCIQALKANLHVLSDVPCVFTIDEADQLWQAAQESRAMFMFGSNPNFWGYTQAAADLHKKGLLGEPYLLEAEYMHDIRAMFDITPWRATFKPIVYSTHSLGPLLRLIDEDLRWVSCFDTGSHINKQPDQHDAMTANFRTERNVVVRITCSFINNFKGGHHWLRVVGTEGAFERTSGRGRIEPPRTLFNTTKLYGMGDICELPVDVSPPGHKGVSDGHGGADYAMLDAFGRMLIEGTPNPIDLRQGLRMSLPGLFAAQSAANNGELTEIRYPWDAKK